MISHGQHTQPVLARTIGVRPRAGDVVAGIGRGDAGGREMLQRVAQSVGAEVQQMVVGRAHARHAELRQPLGRRRRSAEEEGVAGLVDRSAAVRDAALKVEDEEVGGACDARERRLEQRAVGFPCPLGGDARPEHGLASEREGQRHAPTTSTDERGAPDRNA
jgi:hypothetical protein